MSFAVTASQGYGVNNLNHEQILNNNQIHDSVVNDAGMRRSNTSSFLSDIKIASVAPRSSSSVKDKIGHTLMNGLSAVGLGGAAAATYLAFSKTSITLPMSLSTIGAASLACVAGAVVAGGLAIYNAVRSCVPSKEFNQAVNAQFKGAEKLIAHFEAGQIRYNHIEQKFELNSELLSPHDIHHLENEFLHNKHGQTFFGSHVGETRVKDMLVKINRNILVDSDPKQAFEAAAKTINKELKYSQTRKIITTALLGTAAGGAAGALFGGFGAPVGAGVGLALSLLAAKGGHVAYKKMANSNLERMSAAASSHAELHANPELLKVLHNLNTYAYQHKAQRNDHAVFRQQIAANNFSPEHFGTMSTVLHTSVDSQIQQYHSQTNSKGSFNVRLPEPDPISLGYLLGSLSLLDGI